ncbi:hypothetical protein BC835DRAFT_527072 [Cytidiella melzeri]|nr:hypothetical protein BC835DRAFT_527072 [Cytidiella melzeri]
MTLLASLPRLRHLGLKRVIWGFNPTFPINFPEAGLSIYARQCKDNALVAFLALCHVTRVCSYDHAHSLAQALALGVQADWHAVLGIITALLRHYHGESPDGAICLDAGFETISRAVQNSKVLEIFVDMPMDGSLLPPKNAPRIVFYAPAQLFHSSIPLVDTIVVDTEVIRTYANHVIG